MKKSTLIMSVTAALVMAAMIFTFTFAASADSKGLSNEQIDAILKTETDPALITSPFIEVSNRVRESIVGVNNYQVSSSYSIGGFDFYFGYGYGGRQQQQPQERLYGTGSGVVVTEYGHILTNYHVVENASRVTVTVEGSEDELAATVVGYDSDLDIAVLLVPGLQLKPVELGDSDKVQVGEWAIVIGNPLGETFARTVTVGVVSALNRDIVDTSTDRYGRRVKITNQMIQVDAAINSGNSGGGMFNVLGQLQGIPARKYTSNSYTSADVDNIGMCIPINVAKPMLREVLQAYDPTATTAAGRSGSGDQSAATGGLTGKPRMGVTVMTLRNSSGTSLPNGAYITEVSAGTPAEQAGLLPGDIVVAVNDTVISDQNGLTSIVGQFGEGDTLKIKVYRLAGLTDIVDLGSWTVDQEALEKLGDGEYIDAELTLKLVDKTESSRAF